MPCRMYSVILDPVLVQMLLFGLYVVWVALPVSFIRLFFADVEFKCRSLAGSNGARR